MKKIKVILLFCLLAFLSLLWSCESDSKIEFGEPIIGIQCYNGQPIKIVPFNMGENVDSITFYWDNIYIGKTTEMPFTFEYTPRNQSLGEHSLSYSAWYEGQTHHYFNTTYNIRK